ncbi:MAG: glycosyltransferase family 2 protein [Deltaproteobacteria bacterium]|jgi:glycosyltransferase involved in cell wall biosynthesis|nr:glycosyltransferase family 2 protein [Deltaproteobacteria bacterium]
MTDPNLISVVIPTWNRAWSIKRAVDSVLAQREANFELIVVDDASTDDTPSLLAPYVQEKKLTLLGSPSQRGVSASRNLGINASQGALIAFLDSDDEWLPNKLKAQLDYMANNPQYLISQCQERWIRGGLRVNPKRKHLKKEGDIFVDSLSLCLISPSAVIIKKSLFDEVGLFDESLPAAEDYDLWLRVTLSHEVGLLNQELVIRHGGRPDQLSSAPGLDKYRVAALKKLLRLPLTAQKEQLVKDQLARREAIYEKGRQKRQG